MGYGHYNLCLFLHSLLSGSSETAAKQCQKDIDCTESLCAGFLGPPTQFEGMIGRTAFISTFALLFALQNMRKK